MDVRATYQKLLESSAAMISKFSDLNDKLFLCRMVGVLYFVW